MLDNFSTFLRSLMCSLFLLLIIINMFVNRSKKNTNLRYSEDRRRPRLGERRESQKILELHIDLIFKLYTHQEILLLYK